MNFPTLYKKNSNGSIQFWEILVHSYDGHGIISTRFGQLDTPNPQETSDVISEGKNTGKKNETSPGKQAEAEAKAKWIKQAKKGYVESVEAAEAGQVHAFIEGGIVPMLAHKFTDHGSKIKYPCYVQPKLDGIRCIAILKDRKCTLWSRTRKQITSMPHIIAEIEKNFVADITLDGELYNHDFKADFEKIVSAVRKDNPEDGYLNVQYHIYDLVNDQSFEERNKRLYKCFTIGNPSRFTYLQFVRTSVILQQESIAEMFKFFKERGYEGAILRNADSKYVNKRSYDLQKVKEFDDGEFEITGIKEGRGKLIGHAIFVCRATNGKEFDVKKDGELSKLKEYFENHDLWRNKKLSVQYQGLTAAEQVPRFPVGIAIRDYE